MFGKARSGPVRETTSRDKSQSAKVTDPGTSVGKPRWGKVQHPFIVFDKTVLRCHVDLNKVEVNTLMRLKKSVDGAVSSMLSFFKTTARAQPGGGVSDQGNRAKRRKHLSEAYKVRQDKLIADKLAAEEKAREEQLRLSTTAKKVVRTSKAKPGNAPDKEEAARLHKLAEYEATRQRDIKVALPTFAVKTRLTKAEYNAKIAAEAPVKLDKPTYSKVTEKLVSASSNTAQPSLITKSQSVKESSEDWPVYKQQSSDTSPVPPPVSDPKPLGKPIVAGSAPPVKRTVTKDPKKAAAPSSESVFDKPIPVSAPVFKTVEHKTRTSTDSKPVSAKITVSDFDD